MLSNRSRRRLLTVLVGTAVTAGCQREDHQFPPDSGSPARLEASEPETQLEQPVAQKPAAQCSGDDIDYREWLFWPTLEPIPPSPVNRRNSAARVHRLRERIERVEVAHEYTRRLLFEMSDAGVRALRETPDWPSLQLRDHGLPPGKDWPVVFLIYIEGDALPYAGHPYGNELWFAEDENPWGFYVWTETGKARAIHPIPFGDGVYAALKEQLGRPDPAGHRAAEAKAEADARCGRTRVVVPERPDPFPNTPRAIIEPAD